MILKTLDFIKNTYNINVEMENKKSQKCYLSLKFLPLTIRSTEPHITQNIPLGTDVISTASFDLPLFELSTNVNST
jgi:hypothetical protein